MDNLASKKAAAAGKHPSAPSENSNSALSDNPALTSFFGISEPGFKRLAFTLMSRHERRLKAPEMLPILAAVLTVLLSSCLLFLMQPIIAKQILPWCGGSAGVWTICLVFFQSVLLFGYGYAHWLTHRTRAGQFTIHIALLLVSCLALPIIPSSWWKPGQDTVPTLRILTLLSVTVGLPYFMLSATAPLLQKWLSGASTPFARKSSVYRLFALSNLGSLVGLLSYPFAIEPFAAARAQAWAWSSAYLVFVILLMSYMWHRQCQPAVAAQETVTEAAPAPSRRRYAYWIGCAALGSVLLLSVTNQITQNVASIPFLWILPLGLYLFSFVICFEGRAGRGWYLRELWLVPAMLGTGAMSWALFADHALLSIYLALPIFMIGLFFGCVFCHGELSRSKPNPTYLTNFYLCISAGGALGGVSIALIAPQVFNSYWETPLALLGLALLGVYTCSAETREPRKTPWLANIAIAIFATTAILVLLAGLPAGLNEYTLGWAKIVKGDARYGCAVLLVVSALLLQRYRMSRAIALTSLLCALTFGWSYCRMLCDKTVFMTRNFYGALRVEETPYRWNHMRYLIHGVIVHGTQVVEPPQNRIPTSYYGKTSGIGRTLRSEHSAVGSLAIGSIGLGAGTLAAYGAPGDSFRVYELNPAVLDIARTRFSYLSLSRARIELVLGDARLSLEREIAQGSFDRPHQRFDVLSVDAFSGDSIPMHLLTREAFAIYVQVVKPDGVIAFHTSNKYLDLPPIIDLIAHDAGFQTIMIADRPDADDSSTTSYWVLATRNSAFLRRPEIADYGAPIAFRPGLNLWTDQRSNLFQVLVIP